MDLNDVKLTEAQKKQLVQLAAARGKTWQQVLDEFLAPTANGERDESVLNAAMRLGVAGSVTGGPDDLATTPAHMEGFGQDKR